MSLIFPNIKPNFIRTIEAPDYSLVSSEFKSGDISLIRTGYQGVSSNLSLEFQHISEADFKNIWYFYTITKGICYSFTLPEIFYSYLPNAVKDSMESISIKWKFSSPPTFNTLVASETRGRYNGNIYLISVTT